MTPVIHCSSGNISFFPINTSITRRKIQLTKHVSANYYHLTSSSQRFLLPRPSLRLCQIYRGGFLSKDGFRFGSIAAVGADVTLEETNPAVSSESTDKTIEDPNASVETSQSAPTSPSATSAKTTPSRPPRKSEMPRVNDDDLIPGASFTGKVRSVQPYGAFVDFGAFTEGLVHVSKMSDGYVKDVGSLVSVGQEVKVRIVEANMKTRKISLTMRDNDDARKIQSRRDGPTSGSSDRPRSDKKNAARFDQKRNEDQKKSHFVKGQVLSGTVKNVIRSGSFVSLPDGEEGFIPVSEEAEGFGSIMGNSKLQIGQEVTARVLRISRGKVTLTMKKDEDVEEMNRQLNKGVWHVATNPFELAFRKNKDIASFLDERDAQKTLESISLTHDETIVKSDAVIDDASTTSEVILEETPTTESSSNKSISLPDDSKEIKDKDDDTVIKSDAVTDDASTTSEVLLEEIPFTESSSNEMVSGEEEPESALPLTVNVVPETLSQDSDTSSTLSGSSTDSDLVEVPALSDTQEATAAVDTGVPTIADSVTNEDKQGDPDTKALEEAPTVDEVTVTDEVKEVDVGDAIVPEEVASLSSQENGDSTNLVMAEDSAGESANGISSSQVQGAEEVDIAAADVTDANDKVETDMPVLVGTVASADSNDDKPEIPETSNGQTGIPDELDTVKATISPALVKQLRDETGAGMMDCKKALSETGGDIVKAQEFLRKKGLASADKKASRATAEGRVGSYIHDSRIGVLIEVNCETDFVSRGEIFKQLVDDLAMQVAACPQVRYLVTEDVPEEFVKKEKEIEMQKEDLLSKPENIRSKIVDGRIGKRVAEFALLEQPFIKNDKMVVKDWVKQTIATIGENIKIRRFIRYNLGEGLEKKSQDFAAEVAAQTTVKESPAAPKDLPVETTETVEKPPAIAVSAALVKQLREETGAGMMDCKKALTETGGDLERAQEYLRKKGLSSADKKSSRLAAEGRISAYIHDSRIGCLIEVNSETDFVARNEKFKELVDDLAMQVVACPRVEFVSIEEIPEDIVKKEKEIEMQREDLQSKPESIREKIVEGRISKRLGELALLEQPFIKDDKVIVKDLVKQTVAALGENIRVRRFVRFTLGESVDK